MILRCLRTDACFKNDIEKNAIHYFVGENAFITAGGKS